MDGNPSLSEEGTNQGMKKYAVPSELEHLRNARSAFSTVLKEKMKADRFDCQSVPFGVRTSSALDVFLASVRSLLNGW